MAREDFHHKIHAGQPGLTMSGYNVAEIYSPKILLAMVVNIFTTVTFSVSVTSAIQKKNSHFCWLCSLGFKNK